MQIVKLGESCLNKFSLDIYMPTVVGLMSFNTMLCLFLALSSGKGVIWDENPKSRKFVSPLFHLWCGSSDTFTNLEFRIYEFF